MPKGFCACLLCAMEGRPRFEVPASTIGRRAMKLHIMEVHSYEESQRVRRGDSNDLPGGHGR